jgi:hypothetical protein
MSDVEVTIKLPEELLRRVQAAGLQVEDLPSLIEELLVQRERQSRPALGSFTELADGIAALPDNLKPTPDEIDEEIRAAREEMAAARRASKPT